MTTLKNSKPDVSSPFDLFDTDRNKEQEGIYINYNDKFWFRIARTGGNNERYKKMLTENLRPFRRAIQSETLEAATAERLMREAFIDGALLGWGTGLPGEGDGIIYDKNKNPLKFNRENAIKLFQDLPDLFVDLHEQAQKATLFRAIEIEQDVKN